MIAYKIPLRHELLNQIKIDSMRFVTSVANLPYNACIQSKEKTKFSVISHNFEGEAIGSVKLATDVYPEPICNGQQLDYYQSSLKNLSYPCDQGLGLILPSAYFSIIPDQISTLQPHSTNPPVDLGMINSYQILNGAANDQNKTNQESSSEENCLWNHNYPNVALANGQVTLAQDIFNMPLQWSMLQPENINTNVTAGMVNSGIAAESLLVFNQTPCLVNEINDCTLATNEFEGDWTLPISITTESLHDPNAKDNDMTEHIE